MPPKHYPKLKNASGMDVGRIRRGYVTVEQLGKAIVATERLEERAAIKVLYYCALRASELGLQPTSHFDPKRGTLDILRLKGSTGHTYKLEPWVLEDLRAWFSSSERPKGDYLFPHPQDPASPLDRFNVYRYWQRAAKRAGLVKDLQHPHVLKHSVATHMLERGDDLLFVQDWIGHKRLENTQIYAELVGKRMAQGQVVMKGLMSEIEEFNAAPTKEE